MEKQNIIKLIKKTKKESDMLLWTEEAYQLIMNVNSVKKITGDIAEVGVYKGGSAKLICEFKGNKTLYLFDTFEGLPELSNEDNQNQFHKGQYKSTLNEVKNYLRKYHQVYYYKGLIQKTSNQLKEEKFSLVNLDLDLYEPTKSALEFFYSRMNKGGILMSHDYSTVPAIKKVFDDFFKDKPETIIQTFGSHGMVVKI